MIVRPAIDLREGQCVQLVGGDYDKELFRLPDPVTVAHDWIDKGFNKLHIIDLDRATGRGTNVDVVKAVCAITQENPWVDIRVGGGIRSLDDIEEILSYGASKVVVGTKAIEEPEWLQDCVEQYPGQLYVAIEVDGREVKVAGWQESIEQSLEELITQLTKRAIAGIFVTAIHVEGRQQGTDHELFAHIRTLTDHAIVASGGVTTKEDIDALAAAGINEVVMGAAIYLNPDLAKTLQDEQYN